MELNRAEIITALVTPFDSQNHLDLTVLEHLTKHLVQTGSQGFVIGGTTGETPTLTHAEKLTLYQEFSQFVPTDLPVIAGCGTNNTQETLEFINEVAQIKRIDYALVVVPYYNKPDQDGMKAHFEYLNEHSKLPMIIYNIPGRTGVKMEKETIVELAQLEKIVGIKQCGPLEDLRYILEKTKNFAVFTGEDAQALAAKELGATGVISVAAHLYGQEMAKMYRLLATGEVSKAKNLQEKLLPKMQALFMYPSPSPVKAVLQAQGFAVGGLRLPLVALNEEKRANLAQALGLAKDALEHELSLELEVK